MFNEASLIPIHVVRIDGHTKFKEFVCDKSVRSVVKSVFHESSNDFIRFLAGSSK